jgi:hypothetical protein
MFAAIHRAYAILNFLKAESAGAVSGTGDLMPKS